MNKEAWKPKGDPRLVHIGDHVMLKAKAGELQALLNRSRADRLAFWVFGKLPKGFTK